MAFFNGLVLGVELSIITWFWRGNIWLGVVVAFALWINTMISTIIGATFPFLAKRMGLDPAMMSASVVTTITDLTGFFLFLGMATVVLQHLA
ncbi:MAG: Magnesium transporter MgtE [Verrucomicrobia bacterium ADurb.Bin345]|nr:MAG: Magnesium transporter MgtE [Verrucomicrobia bacterium ADurb.Bin345]